MPSLQFSGGRIRVCSRGVPILQYPRAEAVLRRLHLLFPQHPLYRTALRLLLRLCADIRDRQRALQLLGRGDRPIPQLCGLHGREHQGDHYLL